ncbi:hypothetical protein [Brevifollis gellanilyticus]|uniref:Uncharacterized protein n=1 Tax=Brevifollis gellanilyticus TaxID=748831 RepID=A0A512M735_9BACT|nr:hypothetical protein [Brevifollis gellanilyticus]GEP42548.1 hypothetical protein BGE01nite_18390 [Brevifollis gellanilyticus]
MKAAAPHATVCRLSHLSWFWIAVILPHWLMAQASGPWSATLLEKAFHIGDESIPAFATPNPSGDKFKGEFTLPANVRHGITDTIYVVMDASDLTSRADKDSVKLLRKGLFVTKLLINGVVVDDLNKYVRGKEGARNIEHLVIPVRGDKFKGGPNVIEIIPGSDFRNLEDFEIHKLVISSKAP